MTPVPECVENQCHRPATARGLCLPCYKRHRRQETLDRFPKTRSLWMPSPAASPLDWEYGAEVLPKRIWSKIRIAERGCWEWTGGALSGYGQVFAGGRMWYVHRLVYTVFAGEIPEGHDLDHYRWPDDGCIGRSCARHTRPTTRRENTLRSDGFTAWNLAKTHCPNGHPYAGQNLYLNKLGYRDCRLCRRARKRSDWTPTAASPGLAPSPAPLQ